jgi:hypothetical protein
MRNRRTLRLLLQKKSKETKILVLQRILLLREKLELRLFFQEKLKDPKTLFSRISDSWLMIYQKMVRVLFHVK